MCRPHAPRLYTLKQLIAEETKIFVNEIFDNLIPTEYRLVKDIVYDDSFYDQYIFKTNSGEQYEVDFFKTLIELNESHKIKKYFNEKNEHINESALDCVDIGFTYFNNVNNDFHDQGFDILGQYKKRTNKNEQYEVLGKVAFIVNEYIINHPAQEIYAIGKDTCDSNINVYNNMYNKLFKSYTRIEDASEYYRKGAFYFIK